MSGLPSKLWAVTWDGEFWPGCSIHRDTFGIPSHIGDLAAWNPSRTHSIRVWSCIPAWVDAAGDVTRVRYSDTFTFPPEAQA